MVGLAESHEPLARQLSEEVSLLGELGRAEREYPLHGHVIAPSGAAESEEIDMNRFKFATAVALLASHVAFAHDWPRRCDIEARCLPQDCEDIPWNGVCVTACTDQDPPFPEALVPQRCCLRHDALGVQCALF